MAKEKQSLAESHPDLAAQWHPTKNGDLTPHEVTAGSSVRIWWKCNKGVDHEWQTAVRNRAVIGSNCPYCSGRKASPSTSLAALFPEIAAYWHPTKNGDLAPNQVRPQSNKVVWWQCKKGSDHEWKRAVDKATKSVNRCPYCSGRKACKANNLAVLHPDVAAQWHPTKNGALDPVNVPATIHKKVWWQCDQGSDHEWQAKISARTSEKTGCPFCANQSVSTTNSLARSYPEIAGQWHPTKNGHLSPEDVVGGSNARVWWQCDQDSDHEWQTKINHRTQQKSGCPFCQNKLVSSKNSVAVAAPHLAAEWHSTNNGTLKPENVVLGAGKKIWWQCSIYSDHEWVATCDSRKRGAGCPYCAGKAASPTNSLATLHPDIAAQWHPTKNGDITPNMVVAGSQKKFWWKCDKDPEHEWQAVLASRRATRTGRQKGSCPLCATIWNRLRLRHFVKSLCDQNLINTLKPSELFVLAQQNGLISKNSGKRKEFMKGLVSGHLDETELKNFAAGDASALDALFGDQSAEQLIEEGDQLAGDETIDGDASETELDAENEKPLPEITAMGVLQAVESDLWADADEEAVGFLVANGVAKLWRLAYDPAKLSEAKSSTDTPREIEYSERIRATFRQQLDDAEQLEIPSVYSFSINGNPVLPNLMQRHIASRVQSERRVGNWSGTGAGKTLSAVLASRVIGANLTVVLCPNAVVDHGWTSTIKNVFPDSVVVQKTLEPKWPDSDQPRFLVLNYEKLQQPDSQEKLERFLQSNSVDFVVIDEIHYTKQRTDEATKRRKMTDLLCETSAASNPKLAVLGMSATPVINNLREGVSMLELTTGRSQQDLSTQSTVNSCLRIHQRLVVTGTRWMPPYPEFSQNHPRVDISDKLDEVKKMPKGMAGVLQLEQMVVREKIDCILDNVERGTVIYAEYIKGIVDELECALSAAGWRVGQYTGEQKAGLAQFQAGEIDVLIGSRAVGTGVDGLQHCANKLIIASAPWTAAAYEQLVGRLVRQGQEKQVEVVFPLTYAEVGDTEWSWCQSRLNRIRYKKSMADAAVDGIVPAGELKSPTDAYQGAMEWLDRLEQESLA